MHSFMSHRNSVTYAGYAENKRIAAAGMYALLDKAFKVSHTNMSGDNISKTGCNPYKRFFHFAFWYTCSVKECPVRDPFKTFFYSLASHIHKKSLCVQRIVLMVKRPLLNAIPN